MDSHCFAILLVPVNQRVFQALLPFQFHRVVEVSGLGWVSSPFPPPHPPRSWVYWNYDATALGLGNSAPGGVSSAAASPRAFSYGSLRLRSYFSHDSMSYFFYVSVRKIMFFQGCEIAPDP